MTAGQQDERHLVADPLLSGDLVGLAAPVSKWAHEVRTPRRARHDPAPGVPRRRRAAAGSGVRVAARWTCSTRTGDAPVPARLPDRTPVGRRRRARGAGRPARRAGRRAGRDRGRRRGRRRRAPWPRWPPLAEALGAPVYGSPAALHAGCSRRRTRCGPGMLAAGGRGHPGRRSPPTTGCCSSAARPSWSTRTRPARRCPRAPSCCTSPPTRRQLGRAYPVRLGVAGDPRPTRRRRCCRWCAARADAAAAADAVEAGRARRTAADRRARGDGARSATAPAPMDPMAARPRPRAGAAAGHGRRRRGHHHRRATSAASTTGPSPGATSSARAAGSAGACRRRSACRWPATAVPVLCVVGDGSAMYSPQALWTAAREQLPVVFAVVEQPPVPDPQELPAGHGGRDRRHGPVRRPWTSTTRRSTSSAWPRRWASPPRRVDNAGDVGDAVAAAVDAGRPAPARAAHHRAGMTDVVLGAPGRPARPRRPRHPRRHRLGGRAPGERWVVLGPQRLGQDDARADRLAVPAPVGRRGRGARRAPRPGRRPDAAHPGRRRQQRRCAEHAAAGARRPSTS